MSPFARTNDPMTSHQATERVRPDSSRGRVLEILRAHPRGMTHQELYREVRRKGYYEGWPNYTDSGIRTRTKELVEVGLVYAVEGKHGRTTSGRASIYWRAVAPGETAPTPQTPQDTLDLGL